MFVLRNVIFLEKEFISERTSGSKVHLEEVQDPQNSIAPQVETQQDSQLVVEPP